MRAKTDGLDREADGWSLGVLKHAASDGTHKIDAAVDVLQRLGMANPTPELHSALRVALTHKSYLYERKDLFPGVTRGLLNSLQRLGAEYLKRQAAVEFFQRDLFHTVGELSKEVAHVPVRVRSWAVEQNWIVRSCAVGSGLKDGPLPYRLTSDLCYQILGVLCLADEETTAAVLAGRVVFSTNERDTIKDPKTELQEQIGGNSIKYEYQREGPDHALIFHSLATDDRGRSARGTGPTKKAASQQAASRFLQHHFPGTFINRKSNAPRSTPVEIPRRTNHTRVVRRLQNMFHLSPTDRPLLSQALIHSSWSYENRRLVTACQQQNNQILAFIGSQILNYEHILTIARHALIDPPEEISFLTLSNEELHTAFMHAGLKPGFLLGVGQLSQGITIEAAANAFQAVVGAVFVARRSPSSLHSEWPSAWQHVWRIVAPERPREADPTTLLQQATSAMKLQLDFEFRTSGPGHAMQQLATAILSSTELGSEVKINGTWITGGRSKAKHQASLAILDVLKQLAERQPAHAYARASDSTKNLISYFVSHQAAVLAIHSVKIQRWVDAQLFGMHWASSPDKLFEWAKGTDKILADAVNLPWSPDHFEYAFRLANDITTGSRKSIDLELSDVLNFLERLETPEELIDSQLERLIQLAGLYRCLGSKESNISLDNLAETWQLLHRERLVVPPSLPDVRLSGIERNILDAAVSALLTPNTHASVEIANAQPLHLRFLASAVLDQAALSRMCTLWSSVSRTVTLTPREHGIDATFLARVTPTSAEPITQAALAALQPVTQPYQAAVANLLHDLKNQLVAARLAGSSPAGTRTARLEQQLAASRHLDQAQALTARLRFAASLLNSAKNESVDIGSFVRRYASGMLARLPSSVSLSIPDAHRSVYVALGESGLTAVLDNLIGNAIEALRDGGSITLEWTADEDEAMVEITDDGPGIPPEVITALETGELVRSTKPGGNGLGLLGVRSLLSQVGGNLTSVPTRSGTGTSWLITLPTVPDTSPEEL